ALAVGLRGVELGIRLARKTEGLEPFATPLQPERMIDRVAGFVPQDAHAPFVFAAFDLEHLRFLEPLEPRVRKVERHRDWRSAGRREPLVREIEGQRKAKLARVELGAQLLNPRRQRTAD